MRSLHGRVAISACVAVAMLVAASIPSSAAASWSQEYAVEYSSGSNYTLPGVWADEDGRVAVTWSSVGGGPPAAWVRAYLPQSGWYTAAQVTTNLAHVPVVRAAAWTPEGKLWIAFDSNSQNPDLNMILYDPGKGWGALETFGPARNLGVVHAELLGDGGGNFTAVWVTAKEPSGLVLVSSLRRGAAAWSAPVQIDNASGQVRDLDTAMLPSGEAAFIWSVDRGNSSEVWVVQTSVGEAPPNAPKLVRRVDAASVADPRVTVRGPGWAVATWLEDNLSTPVGERLVSAAFSELYMSNWTDAREIAQAPWIEHADMAGGAGGRPIVVWEQAMGTGTVTCYSILDDGGNWTPATALHEAPGSSRVPSIAAGPNGSAWAVWWGLDNGAGSVWAREYLGGWLPATRLSQGPHPAPESARIAVDGRGAAWAVWTDGSPTMYWVLSRAAGLPPGEDIAHIAGSGPTSGPAWLLAAPLILVAAAVLVTFFVYRRGK